MAGGFPSIQGYGLWKLIRWIRLVGTPPTQTGADSLSHMLFVQHERPEVYKRTFKFLEPMDFINAKLTGRCVASQVTAMPMILTDNRTTECRQYDAKLLKIFRVCNLDKLPELLPNDGVVGPLLPAVADELGLAHGTPVIVGAGDNHTAAIGAGAVRDYETAAVVGTSGFLSAHVPAKKTDLLNFIGTVPSPLPGRHLIFAEQGGAGRVLDAFLNTHFDAGASAETYDQMNALAASVPPGSDDVLFLPWFGGTLSPHEDPKMRGGFVNLSYRTTRAHLTRSVLEGLALNFRWLVGPAQAFMGRPLDHLRFAGGGAKSNLWAQILADVVNLPIHQLADPRNGNVRGIAFLAFHRLGHLPLEEIPSRVVVQQVFEPRPEVREVYEHLFAQFLRARKKLTPLFHSFHGFQRPAAPKVTTT